MFGWFKKNDGFEWREYVRTTILLKRKKRKDKIKQAGAAALDGLKAAGKAGASAGASGAAAAAPAMARGAASLAQAPIALLKALLKAVAIVLSGLRSLLARTIGPLFSVISPPQLRGPLAVIGSVALIAAVTRLPSSGLDSQTRIAGGIGLAALALAGIPWLLTTERLRLPPALGEALQMLGGKLPNLPKLGANAGGSIVLLALAGTIGWAGWHYSGSERSSSVLAGLPLVSAKPIEGRASAIGADLIRIAGTTVRLAGIDAPERDQKCKRQGSRSWPCGQAAAEALGRAVRGRTATCELSGKDDAGYPLGLCKIDGKDIAAELVRAGHVFASTGIFARYASAESEAKAAKAGVWKGDGERPGEWRAKRWEQAKRSAPDGCPIKGHVTDEGRVYILPWSPAYDSVKIRASKGERWFCSEQEARAAGWKAHQRG